MKSITFSCLFVTVCLLFSTTTKAQAFTAGTKILSIGVGVGNPYWGSAYKTSLPINPTLTYESQAFIDQLSIGGTIAYSRTKFDYLDLKYNGIYIGARGAYHFDINQEKVDLYAGAGLGYVIISVSDKASGYSGAAASGVGYTAFGGARYYFAPAIGVYAELGYGSFSILNAGISFKF